MTRHDMTRRDTARHGTARHDTAEAVLWTEMKKVDEFLYASPDQGESCKSHKPVDSIKHD